MTLKSTYGLPANRESELRDATDIINAGFMAFAMKDGVTRAQLEGYGRQRDFLMEQAHARYRSAIA